VGLARAFSAVAGTWLTWQGARGTASTWLRSTAVRDEWHVLDVEFRRWAAAQGLGPVLACAHEPFSLQLVALDGALPLSGASVVSRRVVRGATVFGPETLAALAELDATGHRRTRPGATAVVRLLDAVASEGQEPAGVLAGDLARLARRDPAGVHEAARLLFGPAARSMVQLVEAVELGRWDRRSLSNLQRWCVARAMTEPATAATWMRHRLARPCAVAEALAAGRRLPPDRRAWLARAAADHALDGGARPGGADDGGALDGGVVRVSS
jgi:hypothetical protein